MPPPMMAISKSAMGRTERRFLEAAVFGGG
jgi:hypothetical protein